MWIEIDNEIDIKGELHTLYLTGYNPEIADKLSGHPDTWEQGEPEHFNFVLLDEAGDNVSSRLERCERHMNTWRELARGAVL